MELWIRSQRNEKLRQGLFKVNEIELGDYDGYKDCIVINNLYCVGIYQTKERASEVLDEIQQRLIDLQILEIFQNSSFTTRSIECVYQMPKE